MARKTNSFDFLEYLAHEVEANGHPEPGRVPSLTDLSKQTGVSISTLREQLEVAKALGLVEVRPRTGIRRLPYQFAPAVHESLSYALSLDRSHFDEYADLRKHVEKAYWNEAVRQLTNEDLADLRKLVDRATDMLAGTPIRIPHQEHRQLHLTIFRHLENPFAQGILEAYWDAYEQVGLSRYEGLDYLQLVWDYHRRIVEALVAGEFDTGYQLLVEHMELIMRHPGVLP